MESIPRGETKCAMSEANCRRFLIVKRSETKEERGDERRGQQ